MRNTSKSTKTLRATYPDVTPSLTKLDERGCTLGRALDCGMVVARPFASRLHARITFDGHYFVLQDNDSANGTYVNGRPLRGPHKLKHGDEIGLGDPTGLITFLDEDKTVQPELRLKFDPRNLCFLWDERPLSLSADQQSLLLYLFERRGEVCERTACAKAVWGHDYDSYMDADALDQVLSRLRGKLRSISADAAELIVTMRGQGYMLKNL